MSWNKGRKYTPNGESTDIYKVSCIYRNEGWGETHAQYYKTVTGDEAALEHCAYCRKPWCWWFGKKENSKFKIVSDEHIKNHENSGEC